MATVDRTRLTMVNNILSASSMGPVAALSPGTRASTFAESVLDEVAQEVQAHGWHFNTDRDVSVAPVAGEVAVPADALRMDPEDPTIDFVERDGKMYDLDKNTFTITRTLRYRIVRYITLDELPAQAIRYLVARAARLFQARQVGDAQTDARLAEDEGRAWAGLIEHEAEAGDANALRDSFSVGRITGRAEVNPLWGA